MQKHGLDNSEKSKATVQVIYSLYFTHHRKVRDIAAFLKQKGITNRFGRYFSFPIVNDILKDGDLLELLESNYRSYVESVINFHESETNKTIVESLSRQIKTAGGELG